ncbi:hypothetical protein VNI00_001716 [Paramarasmius palmivorus]|uniref:Uncharacterized protein n=1 Tax=Paramarasmius palmivorus TaxID=297713 RepID=A0AAW0E4S9_9AGAR
MVSTSLAPHICIASSPDLSDLLAASSLPPLPDILQSFSPFPQVTTRTTSLTSVSHKSFALRFSDLKQIEDACKEDEERRAARTLDWIGSRISQRCVRWVEDMEKLGDKAARIPWWEEVKRCAEGDHVPSRNETWNHPSAVILAVSTNSSNPLQAITALHSRPIDLPSWVDPLHLKFTLIIHPKNSSLSDEEATALYNAVKKQYGLHTYLLPLELPNPPPNPVPVPVTPLRLPPPTMDSPEIRPPPTPLISPSNSQVANTPLNTLRMNEKDIQQTARFTREFLVMSLVPWMEKCVVEWNENTTAVTSFLLDTSTLRVSFPLPRPGHHSNSSSISSTPVRSATINGALPTAGNHQGSPPPQQRRLAEFATILGDLKLAVSVWESIRKEGRGGSDILPLLLSPSPTLELHASNAISSLYGGSPDPTPQAQLHALQYAVRWETGIDASDFLGFLEGERWLVWAAGNSDEAVSAILLAYAAYLSVRKRAPRRAAFWYVSAANRLEKYGIKPLTMYLLRRAHDLCKISPSKELSPSFWESEGIEASKSRGFDSIMAGIEHPLARLLYTTGDVSNAVRIFLDLLKSSGSSTSTVTSADNGEEVAPPAQKDGVYLEDFRVALEHYKSITSNLEEISSLRLSISFCVPQQTGIRYPRSDDGDEQVWERREEDWKRFCKSQGVSERLVKDYKASVGGKLLSWSHGRCLPKRYYPETFYVDLVLQNPYQVEVNLGNLTVAVRDSNTEDPSSSKSFVQAEILDNVTLRPRETRTVPIAIKSSRPATLLITHATYDFLSLLPTTEALSYRGKRLHATPAQRQKPTYAPDVVLKVEVAEADQRLLANFVDEQEPRLLQGENVNLRLWLSNAGQRMIGEVWIVAAPEDQFWLNEDSEDGSRSHHGDIIQEETLDCRNSLVAKDPYKVPVSMLQPGDNHEVRLTLNAGGLGERKFCVLILYREHDKEAFHQVRVTQSFEVTSLFQISAKVYPAPNTDDLYAVDLQIENSSSKIVEITQISTLSPTWACRSVTEATHGPILALQSCQLRLYANPWQAAYGHKETEEYVARKLKNVLQGRDVELTDPPVLGLCVNHVVKTSRSRLLGTDISRRFIYDRRRHAVVQSISSSHPHIPTRVREYTFPLYNPASLDILVLWSIPSEGRSGIHVLSDLCVGVGHAALREILEETENMKATRSMYSETQQERAEILQAISNSEWNTEMNPLVVQFEGTEVIKHDFTKGPCYAPVSIIIRNFSLTHDSRFILQLNGDQNSYLPSLVDDDLPAPYSGRLTHRGLLKPLQVNVVKAKLWITRPGSHVLGGWCLKTEVLEPSSEGQIVVRHRYLQESPEGRTRVVVSG